MIEADGANPKVAGERSEQEQVRRDKLGSLRTTGVDPSFAHFRPTATVRQLRTEFAALEPGAFTGHRVGLAGRLVRNRITGKLIFGSLRDWTGDIQVMLDERTAGAAALDRWKRFVDLGDLIGVTGEIVSSKRGELSVLVEAFEITAKCLVPLPDKHKGLTDPESRVRRRYVDLMVNDESRQMLVRRSKLVRSVRESLWDRGFVEVETPMLQTVHGGANARPFRTHINAYDLPLYLRIAPELYLKKLLVGGADRVFEVNRNFRNEGADSTHNPEFTSLEMYEAYGTYETMRELTRELIINAAVAVHGDSIVLRPGTDDGLEPVDISGDWPVVDVHEAVSEAVGQPVDPGTDAAELATLCRRHGVEPRPAATAGALVLELYEHLVESRTTKPTFYRDFPVDTSPLTRRKASDPRLAERWDLVAWGSEIATAYTELTDPLDQRERLTQQARLAAAGDPEAMQLDEDFLRSLEYGMPPAGGQGMGIDRLLMLLTGRNIRETILFPLVKPDTGRD